MSRGDSIRFGHDPLVLDDDTADRLLDGLAAADAPPAYAVTAALLGSLRMPASDDELAGELAALAAFRSVRPPVLGISAPAGRRRWMTRRVPALAMALGLVGVISATSAAAATGSLPAAAQRAAHLVLSAAGLHVPDAPRARHRDPHAGTGNSVRNQVLSGGNATIPGASAVPDDVPGAPIVAATPAGGPSGGVHDGANVPGGAAGPPPPTPVGQPPAIGLGNGQAATAGGQPNGHGLGQANGNAQGIPGGSPPANGRGNGQANGRGQPNGTGAANVPQPPVPTTTATSTPTSTPASAPPPPAGNGHAKNSTPGNVGVARGQTKSG